MLHRERVALRQQEKMMAENKPFEIPPQVRELAEKNIDQARKFYD